MVEQSKNSFDGTKEEQVSQDDLGSSNEENKDKNRLDILYEIMELEFACIDLNLYLDTHPNDQRALMQYNTLASQLKQLKNQYELIYGPLSNFGCSLSKYPWEWIVDPWPWEIEY